ncbi:MAG: V-type ATP synthase subunit E family protein [Candidatus Hodarchaeales archaeon]
MDEVPEGILNTLDSMLESMIAEIDLETKKQIQIIEKETKTELTKIEELIKEHRMNKENLRKELLKELNVRRKFWLKKLNQERSVIIEQFFLELQNMINKIPRKKSFLKTILKALVTETLESFDHENLIIHVTKGTSDLIVKSVSTRNTTIIDDLSEIGTVVVDPNKGITVQNTLESRLLAAKKDIIIMINKMLFKDLEEPPWSVSKILDTSMQDFTG